MLGSLDFGRRVSTLWQLGDFEDLSDQPSNPKAPSEMKLVLS